MNLDGIPQIKHTDSNNFFLLSGPCAIEGEEMALRIAEKIVTITDTLKIPYVFKGSFKKGLLGPLCSRILLNCVEHRRLASLATGIGTDYLHRLRLLC